MPELDDLLPRVSAFPWRLHQAEHLASKRAESGRDGFYVGMLRDDLHKQRYAYDVSLMVNGADRRRSSEILSALLHDFHGMGYYREPAALICGFANVLFDESVDGDGMLLELHALSDEDNGPKSARRVVGTDNPGLQDVRPSLGLIPGWSTTRAGSDVAQESLHAGQRGPVIPRGRVHYLRMRNSNRSKWQQVVKELRQVDALESLGGDLDRLRCKGYTLSEHQLTQNLAIAAATAPIGWDARGMFSELVTSPYLAFRRLRLAHFWVQGVEDSVQFLNHHTGNESLYGSNAFTFSLSGLPDPDGLTEAMREIRAGSLTLEAARDRYLFPKRRGASD